MEKTESKVNNVLEKQPFSHAAPESSAHTFARCKQMGHFLVSLLGNRLKL